MKTFENIDDSTFLGNNRATSLEVSCCQLQHRPPIARQALRPSRQRSRVTNGSKLVAAVDGRSAEARRYKYVAFCLADDLGGAAGLTEAQRALVRQIAAMTVQLEKLQGAVLRGELVDVEQLTRLSNALSRMLHRLGVKRVASKTTSPSLASYLASKASGNAT